MRCLESAASQQATPMSHPIGWSECIPGSFDASKASAASALMSMSARNNVAHKYFTGGTVMCPGTPMDQVCESIWDGHGTPGGLRCARVLVAWQK
jgi:hypothetical protein